MRQFFGGGYESSSGEIVTSESALRVAAVSSCVRVVAETIAMLPMSVYRRTERGRIAAVDHPLARTLARPNSWQTPFEFVEFMQRSLELRGNAYAYIGRAVNPISGKGFIDELIPLHPDRTEIVVDSDRTVGYRVQLDPTGKRGAVLVPGADVLHIRGAGSDGFRGQSTIQAAAETIGAAQAATRYTGAMMRNGTRLSGVLKHPGTLGDDAHKRLRDTWEETFSGPANAARTAILEEGMDFSAMSMTAVDAELIAGREFSLIEICGLFRVPPHKIGYLKDAHYSNVEHQNIEFVTNCIAPRVVRWEQAISRCLIDASDLYYVKFNLDAINRGDIKTRYEAHGIARQWGWASANDIREKEDMNPIENGDIYLQPMNMIPAGTPIEQYAKGGGSSASGTEPADAGGNAK